MSGTLQDVLLEGVLTRIGASEKKRYMVLTHGALFEYADWQKLKLHHTYEITLQSHPRRVADSASFFDVDLRKEDASRIVEVRFAAEEAEKSREVWMTKLGLLLDRMLSEERALKASRFSSSKAKPYRHGFLMKCIFKGDAQPESQSNPFRQLFQTRFLLLRNQELLYFTTDQSQHLNSMSMGDYDRSACKGVIKITSNTTVKSIEPQRNLAGRKCPFVLDVHAPESRMKVRLQPMVAVRAEMIRDLLGWARAITASIESVKSRRFPSGDLGRQLRFNASLEAPLKAYGAPETECFVEYKETVQDMLQIVATKLQVTLKEDATLLVCAEPRGRNYGQLVQSEDEDELEENNSCENLAATPLVFPIGQGTVHPLHSFVSDVYAPVAGMTLKVLVPGHSVAQRHCVRTFYLDNVPGIGTGDRVGSYPFGTGMPPSSFATSENRSRPALTIGISAKQSDADPNTTDVTAQVVAGHNFPSQTRLCSPRVDVECFDLADGKQKWDLEKKGSTVIIKQDTHPKWTDEFFKFAVTNYGNTRIAFRVANTERMSPEKTVGDLVLSHMQLFRMCNVFAVSECDHICNPATPPTHSVPMKLAHSLRERYADTMRLNLILNHALDGWCVGRLVSVEGVQEHFAGKVLWFAVELRESGAEGAKGHNKFTVPEVEPVMDKFKDDNIRDSKAFSTTSYVFPNTDDYCFVLKLGAENAGRIAVEARQRSRTHPKGKTAAKGKVHIDVPMHGQLQQSTSITTQNNSNRDESPTAHSYLASDLQQQITRKALSQQALAEWETAHVQKFAVQFLQFDADADGFMPSHNVTMFLLSLGLQPWHIPEQFHDGNILDERVSFCQLMQWWMQQDTQDMLQASRRVYKQCMQWEVGGCLDKQAVEDICRLADIPVEEFIGKYFATENSVSVSTFMADYCELMDRHGIRGTASEVVGALTSSQGSREQKEFEAWSRTDDTSLHAQLAEAEAMYHNLRTAILENSERPSPFAGQ